MEDGWARGAGVCPKYVSLARCYDDRQQAAREDQQVKFEFQGMGEVRADPLHPDPPPRILSELTEVPLESLLVFTIMHQTYSKQYVSTGIQ